MIAPSAWTSVLVGSPSNRPPTATQRHEIGFWDVYCLGVTIVIGGQFYGWNTALTHGFNNVLISFVLVSCGYLCLSLCVAEMSSFFPFGGGFFGYTRCIVHPFLGFLVGIAELVEYILYVAAAVMQLGVFLSTAFGTSAAFEPVWWVLFFLSTTMIQSIGGRSFWSLNALLALIPVVIIVFFFFASVPSADIHWTTFRDHSASPATSFMETFPTLSWLFVGIEGMILASEDAPKTGRVVPKAVVACWATLFVSAIMVVFGSVTQFPGTTELANEAAVLSPVFQTVCHMSKQAAMLLTLPGAYGTAFGFQYAAGKLLASMSQSQALPAICGQTHGVHHTPVIGLMATSGASLSLLFLLRYAESSQIAVVFNVCMLGSCFVYVCVAYSFLICADRYSNLPRLFVNPLGRYGAMFAMAVFALMMVSLAFFQADYSTLIVFVVIMCLTAGYYQCYAKTVEFFSEDEINTFMKAYIINANLRRRDAIKRSSKKRHAALLLKALSNNKVQADIAPDQGASPVVEAEEDAESTINLLQPTPVISVQRAVFSFRQVAPHDTGGAPGIDAPAALDATPNAAVVHEGY